MRSFVIYTHTRNYPGGQIEKDDIGALSDLPHTNEFYMFATATGESHRESYMHHNHTGKMCNSII